MMRGSLQPQILAAGRQNAQFCEASVPAGLRPTSAPNGSYVSGPQGTFAPLGYPVSRV